MFSTTTFGLRPGTVLLCGLVALASLPGCSESGPALAPVTGVVTMDGNPLPGVVVSFDPQVDASDGGATSHGITDSSGRYTLNYPGGKAGAVVAEHEISVSYEEGASGAVKIPPRYNSKTELTRKVEAGANEINLELTSK